MNTKPSPIERVAPDRLLAALEPTEAAQAALADLAQAELQDREGLVRSLQALVARAEKEIPQLSTLVTKAVAAQRSAEAALLKAKLAVDEAVRTRADASFAFDTERQAIERSLSAGASSAIDDFIREMHTVLCEKIPQPHLIDSRSEKHPITGRRSEYRETNKRAIEAFLAAAREAVAEAEDMRLEADQSTVPERLAALRETLPKY